MGMLLSAYTNANERINGIDYVILSSTDRTAAVSENISASGNVTIPSKITISGVTYNVVLIADCAFEFSTDISSLTIPNSVTSIGNSAFSGCRNLSSLTIPNSVTAIGPYAFYGCDGLTSIKVQSGNSKYDSRDNCNAIIETASNKLVAGCKNTIIPNSVTSIGAYAFVAYSSLTSINIPYSVTSIGDCSFYGCSGLTSVTIPNSVTSIGNQAFSGCTNLSSVISEIEKPLYISDGSYNPFYSVSPTCTLTVPSGTKDAYIATGWTTDVFKGGIVEAPYNPASKNKLTITDAEVCKGKQTTLPVNMNNTESITALQFEVSLPEGVSISKCQLTERKGEDHTVSYKILPNGNYQVTAISLSKANFDGTAGALLNLTLDVDEGVTADDYTISLTNIELTTANTQAVNPADVSATLTVSDVKIADADGNGKVSITDAVAIVSYILGDGMDGFVAAAADVDGNGKITITDAVAVVDMILSGSASAKMRVEMDEEMLDPQ